MTGKKRKENNKVYQKPKQIFENSGYVNPQEAYYIPLENVVNTRNQDMKTMVDRGRFFSIFAPRQSGKTTFLEKTREQLQEDPTYIVILLSFQKYQQLEKTRFYELL
ncbi:MAG: hypothetical protein GY950_16175, partial [bacterium]|nr:hypothetical protein [bacterium]